VGNRSRRHQPRLLLRFERAPTPAEPGQPRRASRLLPAAAPAPRSAEEPIARLRGAGERMVPESPGPFCGQGPPAPWAAGFLFITLPVTRLEEEELGEGASLWPAGPCQPSGKGTARESQPSSYWEKRPQRKRKAGSSPLRWGWLSPRQPHARLCWPGVSVLPTSPLHPTPPYVPPAKEPPPQRAPAVPTVSSLREQ